MRPGRSLAEPMRGRVVRAAVPRRPVEVEVLDEVHAPHHRGAQLPVGGEDPVGSSRAKALPTWAASWPASGGYTASSP